MQMWRGASRSWLFDLSTSGRFLCGRSRLIRPTILDRYVSEAYWLDVNLHIDIFVLFVGCIV